MTAVNDQGTTEARVKEAAITRVGGAVARYGLVVVIAWIGLLKFTAYEAQGIQPLVANSPIMGWVYDVLSVTAFSTLPKLSMTGQFLIKDVALLGIAVWTLADALRTERIPS